MSAFNVTLTEGDTVWSDTAPATIYTVSVVVDDTTYASVGVTTDSVIELTTTETPNGGTAAPVRRYYTPAAAATYTAGAANATVIGSFYVVATTTVDTATATAIAFNATFTPKT